MATIAANCDDVLDFLQAVIVKSPWITAVPLLLCTDKCARVWFRRWAGNKLPPTTNAPKYHRGITGVLNDVVTSLQHAKYICPVIVEQRKSDKETKGWDCLPPTEQLRQDDNTNLAATCHPPINQQKERNRSTSGLCPDLCRTKHPFTNTILLGPPPGANPRDARPGRPNRLVSPYCPP